MLSVIKVPRLSMTSVSLPSVEPGHHEQMSQLRKVPIVGDDPDKELLPELPKQLILYRPTEAVLGLPSV